MPKSKPKKSKPKASAKKASKPAAKKPVQRAAKKAAKPAAKKVAKPAPKKAPAPASKSRAKDAAKPVDVPPNSVRPNGKSVKTKLTQFEKQQRERLIVLRDTILDSMAGVAKDTLRARPEGNEASAFGMHQADAGSDAYDKDFALSLLSQEQDALYEIEEALKRIEYGTYGVCESSGKPIPVARLQALPFARLTVECQAEFERTKRFQHSRTPVTSLFGLTDSEGGEEPEETEEQPTKPQQAED